LNVARGKQVIARSAAARDLDVTKAFIDARASYQAMKLARKLLDRDRQIQVDSAAGAHQPLQVLAHGEGPVVVEANGFVDAVGEEEAAVFDADPCLLKRHD